MSLQSYNSHRETLVTNTPAQPFPCAGVDSVAIPDGWTVVRGFNVCVDEETDDAGWQYSNTFFSESRPGSVKAGERAIAPVTSIDSGSSRRSQASWSKSFNEALHSVRRRLWCRVMCPLQVQEKALSHMEKYITRNPRGSIFSTELLVESAGCCVGHKFEKRRIVVTDSSVEFYSGSKRVGRFPFGHTSRISQRESNLSAHSKFPYMFRIEDVSINYRNDSCVFATSDPLLRMLCVDVLRIQIGLLDYGGKDVEGGPPEDPSIPMYNSSLVTQLFYSSVSFLLF
jgi:hypothetical protein